MRNIAFLLFVFSLTIIFPSVVYANMALPDSYYYGSSLGLLLVMAITDYIAFRTVLKLLKLKITGAQFTVSLFIIVLLGIAADVLSLILANISLNIFYPTYSQYHLGASFGYYANLFSLSEFYQLGTYLNNFTSHFPEYVPPIGVGFLVISAFILITLFNFVHKFILNIDIKRALLLALFLGVFTNPFWGLYNIATLLWILILGILTIFLRSNKYKARSFGNS